MSLDYHIRIAHAHHSCTSKDEWIWLHPLCPLLHSNVQDFFCCQILRTSWISSSTLDRIWPNQISRETNESSSPILHREGMDFLRSCWSSFVERIQWLTAWALRRGQSYRILEGIGEARGFRNLGTCLWTEGNSKRRMSFYSSQFLWHVVAMTFSYWSKY